MSTVVRATRRAIARAASAVERAVTARRLAEPARVQERLLAALLDPQIETAFGRDHRLASVRTVEELRRRVPIRTYEELLPYLRRVHAGEPNVLVPGRPRWLVATSGTDAEPKWIPASRSFLRAGGRHARRWLLHALADHPRLLDGPMLAVVGRAVEGLTPGGLPYGSASGQMARTAPFWLRRRYAVPYAVFDVEDYERRVALVALFAVGAPIRSAASPSPLTLVRIVETAAALREPIVRSLVDGRIDPAIEPDRRRAAALEPFLSRRRRRGRWLSRRVDRWRGFRPADYWPELELVGCWTGGTIGAQLARLRPLLGEKVAVRDLGYLASEGRFSLPLEDEVAEGALALDQAFFELVPGEESGAARPRTLLAHEVEVGRRYEVVVTNAAGLWRYRIGDIVEVTGRVGATPLVAFVRKAGETTSLCGEKLHARQVAMAMERAAARTGLDAVAYRFVARADRLAYDVLVELAPGAGGATPPVEELALSIDEELGRINLEYDAKRRSRRLGPPRVVPMPPGWSEALMRRAFAEGRRDVQYKWKVLVDREDDAGREGRRKVEEDGRAPERVAPGR